METISLDKDIKIVCLTAKSFPLGVQKAHHELHALLPNLHERQFFGISYGNTEGGITYKAAASALSDSEAEELGFEGFTIKKGKYISQNLKDYMSDLTQIGQTFQNMLQHPQLDPKGYCVEMYLSPKEVQCLVKLND
ncbi:MAG: hypothetical protein JNL70_22865 [Saprospiraceae bacterium]|nr:hypothetical protein [Saprospiraceae bacterium]